MIGAVLAVFAAVLFYGQSPATFQNPPTFQSGVELIEVDVIVTDRQGKSVRDLTKDDFEILEKGRT